MKYTHLHVYFLSFLLHLLFFLHCLLFLSAALWGE